ncbi:GNAT family N-acetyltransferase [Streptomyces sp. 1331.2]|uniref:GNAT family N-acetyltransferase n=1 Tax=Streptomyces sp. 1331.2 TaxID=1938835 RepID=UPI000BD51840|nr:GNAT family N-acetyltransferase [Streptomyces sp. 1331.2]SOB79785.1 Predicted N-acetyltransferase YhbS [Streptomyces sp. 1331.2]
MTDTRIRLLREDDWDAVVALEERAYAASGLSEGREALQSRHRASPDTCFVLEHAGRLGGYLLALPYPLFRCPDLSRSEERGTGTGEGAAPGNMHAHDLVISEELRGRGLSHRMLRHLEDTARAAGHRTISLVAVRGSHVLWTPLGYRARPEVELPASYGSRAVYMAMPLDPGRPAADLSIDLTADPTSDLTADPTAGPRSRAEVG